MVQLIKFSDRKVSEKLLEKVDGLLGGLPDRRIRIMEVCGTHTMNIFTSGLRSVLPESLRLVSGPGCPVCVTPSTYMDEAINLSRREDVIIATFGDMMRVPGSFSSLEEERGKGAQMEVVYSVTDALNLAQSIAPWEVVFLGVGFETTAPTVARAILEAREKHIMNFSVLTAHKLIPPAMEALLMDRSVRINAFLCPGHVSAVIGAQPYEKISGEFGKPCVVSGFEPLDILQSIIMILTQISGGAPRTEIQYTRCVKYDGNVEAQKAMESVFETCDSVWRGLGTVPKSGLRVKDDLAQYDARVRFEIDTVITQDEVECSCGDILRGIKEPGDCLLFGNVCTPANPVGPCMVSSEGTCSAYFKYGSKT